MSGVHVIITKQDKDFYLTDNNSTNGTWIQIADDPDRPY